VLTDEGWEVLLGNLDRIAEAAARMGITATLHPHVGTMVETAGDVERVLAGSEIGLCLDTGHLMIGGADRWPWPPTMRQGSGIPTSKMWMRPGPGGCALVR